MGEYKHAVGWHALRRRNSHQDAQEGTTWRWLIGWIVSSDSFQPDCLIMTDYATAWVLRHAGRAQSWCFLCLLWWWGFWGLAPYLPREACSRQSPDFPHSVSHFTYLVEFCTSCLLALLFSLWPTSWNLLSLVIFYNCFVIWLNTTISFWPLLL